MTDYLVIFPRFHIGTAQIFLSALITRCIYIISLLRSSFFNLYTLLSLVAITLAIFIKNAIT